MSDDVRYNEKSIRLLYYRYKDTPYFSIGILVGVIIISALLLIRIVIPQINDWFSIRQETEATQERIQTIKSNTAYASTYDGNLLSQQIDTVSAALPPEKDFAGILNAINEAAIRSQVSLGNYDFSVGELTPLDAGDTLYPTHVEITISNDFVAAARFIQEIEEKIPLVTVESLQGSTEATNITLNFAYKAFPKVTFNDSEPIKQFTPEQQSLLDLLESWRPGVALPVVPVASDSAVIQP